MIKAVLADLSLLNPAKHTMLEEPFPEVFVPTWGGPTLVLKLFGRAKKDGTFTADSLAIPGVRAGEYVYCFARFGERAEEWDAG